MLFKFILIILLIGLTSCGFEPLYKEVDKSLVSNLSLIEIVSDNKIISLKLKQTMQDQLNPNFISNIQPDYRLTFNLSYDNEPQLLQNDSFIDRYRIILKVDYQLIKIVTNEIILNESIKTISSFNSIKDLEYNTYVSEQDAIQNSFNELSKKIRNKLIIYFYNH